MKSKADLARFLVCAVFACAGSIRGLYAAERISASDAGYILRTLPPRHESQDPEARAPVEVLWSQLLAELRQVPGITLLPAGAALPPGDDRAEYHLIIASLPTTRLANGGESYVSLYDPTRRGMYTAASGRIGRQWPVEVRVERDGRDTTRGNINAITFLYREDAPRPAICQQEHKPETLHSGSDCWNSAELAEKWADSLRLEKLPPDDGMYRKLVARIADPALGERQRSLALNSLAIARREGRFVELDEAGVTAIAGFADTASSPMRGLIWRTLRGGSPSQFVPSMLQTLRSDSDEETRLEAFTTLAEDHGDDPGVRAAFQAVAREDRRELIRMLATRALGGDAAWREYVIATLKNDQLSAQQRTEPWLYIDSRAREAEMRALAGLPALAEAMLEVARDTRSVTDVGDRGAIRRSLGALRRFADPALLASLPDWPALQQEFGAGGVVPAAGPPAWTGLPAAPAAAPAPR